MRPCGVNLLLAKVSGDLVGNKQVEDEIKGMFDEYMVYLIIGAGKQFSAALKAVNIDYVFNDEGNRVVPQQALRICYEGPQREILEYYKTAFNGDIGCNLIPIPPISEEKGRLENTNADVRFERFYNMRIFEKGIVYTKEGRDKSHLQKEGVEIRYI